MKEADSTAFELAPEETGALAETTGVLLWMGRTKPTNEAHQSSTPPLAKAGRSRGVDGRMMDLLAAASLVAGERRVLLGRLRDACCQEDAAAIRRLARVLVGLENGEDAAG